MADIKQSQRYRIRKYLEKGKSITPWKALILFGCFRLGARIWELRHRYNMDIVTIKEKGKSYATYKLREVPEMVINI